MQKKNGSKLNLKHCFNPNRDYKDSANIFIVSVLSMSCCSDKVTVETGLTQYLVFWVVAESLTQQCCLLQKGLKYSKRDEDHK